MTMGTAHRYRVRPAEVTALRVDWSTWSEMCEFAPVGEGGCVGVYVHPTDDTLWSDQCLWEDPRIGILLPTKQGVTCVVEGQWVVRSNDGEFTACDATTFAQIFVPTPATDGPTATVSSRYLTDDDRRHAIALWTAAATFFTDHDITVLRDYAAGLTADDARATAATLALWAVAIFPDPAEAFAFAETMSRTVEHIDPPA